MQETPSREAQRAQAFMRLGQPAALWSSEGCLLVYNLAFGERFNCFGHSIPAGISQSQFMDKVERSGLLVRSVTTASDNLPRETDILAGRQLFFSDGTVCSIEAWPAGGGNTVMLCLDVTETNRNARALERAKETAVTADQTKSRFLRAANHDLRQPLASLKILIYTCMAAQTAEERDQALHAMDVSVAIMEDLLGALLNIGQLDAGKVEPRIQTFQIATILERLRVQFDNQAQEKGLDLRIVPSKASVESDRALLERILTNFVGNAIRYTDTGRVLVGCRRYGKALRIAVYDTGCGIPEQFHEAIFDEFFRVAEHQIYRKHSLGLGLNIAKRLAEVLGHHISVRSTPGLGSVFSIEVPVGDIWNSSVGEPEINEKIGGEFAGLVGLVLEDDVNLRTALATLLERWGMEVLTFDAFDDIEHSLAELGRRPDIIITDYRLRGGIQGTDVVNIINDLLDQPCPAVVVTADTSPDLIASIRKQGFPVLIKPISPPGLRVIMHNILFEPDLVPEIS
ncbi:ATP-binding response regulator [Sinorhizobium meliloti]|uniref:ATP-binding response regulator n=1 Tax=Rhizobium meliloti TaxID=382 RepID=UPI00209048BB|nr:hybrid sensor histidine kinase/response regulator [Sinorhizobium meliloti]MCO5966363.1 hybrid sensor histidine kinase/response regulator [Sinorhizobium meliloti]